jgi:RNase P subunit RPR2
MEETRRVRCAWCEKETIPDTTKEKSQYGDIVVRRCSQCGNIIASYLDEKRVVLEKVRLFQN